MELPEKTQENRDLKKPLSARIFKFVYVAHIVLLVLAAIADWIERYNGYSHIQNTFAAISVSYAIFFIWFYWFIPFAFLALLLSFFFDLISKRTDPAVKSILIKSALLFIFLVIAVLAGPFLIRADTDIFFHLFRLTGDFSIDNLILAALPLLMVIYYHKKIGRIMVTSGVLSVVKPKAVFRVFYIVLIAVLILAYWAIQS